MPTPLHIDFVSDVSCPWCAIGLWSLSQALEQLGDAVNAELHFRPFELNPQMPPGGQDLAEHLHHKYGSTPEQRAQVEETLRQRGEALGFTFNWQPGRRIYNTFDAHRLLYWAGLPEVGAGRQLALKRALLEANFTLGEAPEAHQVLLRLVGQVGLDTTRSGAILDGDEFASEVRAEEQRYIAAGIHSVPAVIVNQHYLISGGQPVEVFEQMLTRIASGQAD